MSISEKTVVTGPQPRTLGVETDPNLYRTELIQHWRTGAWQVRTDGIRVAATRDPLEPTEALDWAARVLRQPVEMWLNGCTSEPSPYWVAHPRGRAGGPASAAAIAAEAARLAAERLEIERDALAHGHGDWTDAEVGRRYCALLARLRFWVRDPRTVISAAPASRDGRLWGYAGSDLLDNAACLFDVDNGRIDQLSPVHWALTLPAPPR